jgi:hypothetical protein
LIFHWFCVYFVYSDRPSGVYFVDSDRPKDQQRSRAENAKNSIISWEIVGGTLRDYYDVPLRLS